MLSRYLDAKKHEAKTSTHTELNNLKDQLSEAKEMLILASLQSASASAASHRDRRESLSILRTSSSTDEEHGQFIVLTRWRCQNGIVMERGGHRVLEFAVQAPGMLVYLLDVFGVMTLLTFP